MGRTLCRHNQRNSYKRIMSNITAFLDMIGVSEGTSIVANSDSGYNVIIGGTLFYNGYTDHPRQAVWIQSINDYSTAAGKYQIRAPIFDAYKKQLNLPDFSPDSQDKIALQLIRECHALDDIDAGKFVQAVAKCSSRWASLPGNNYGQRQNTLLFLQKAYVDAGGYLSADGVANESAST